MCPPTKVVFDVVGVPSKSIVSMRGRMCEKSVRSSQGSDRHLSLPTRRRGQRGNAHANGAISIHARYLAKGLE